jgi:hypothetical protein
MAFFSASNPAGGGASAELGSELPDVFTDVCPTTTPTQYDYPL